MSREVVGAAPLFEEPKLAEGSSPAGGPTPTARQARVRVVSLTDGPGIGDAESLILMSAPLLQRQGFEMTAACLRGWGAFAEAAEERGLRVVAFGARGLLDPRGAGRILSFLRRERTQIVHAHRFLSNLAARLFGRAASVPVVITTHRGGDRGWSLGRRLAERLTAPLGDAVLVSSEAMRRDALAASGLRPGRVHTLRDATEIPAVTVSEAEGVRRDLGGSPADLLVGAGGGPADAGPGLSIFLAAAGLLSRELPRVRFVLLSEGAARRSLEAQAAREGVSHRLVFAPARPETLRALDLFVEPSLKEASGPGILAAMAAGGRGAPPGGGGVRCGGPGATRGRSSRPGTPERWPPPAPRCSGTANAPPASDRPGGRASWPSTGSRPAWTSRR